jgi:hypothetical protein
MGTLLAMLLVSRLVKKALELFLTGVGNFNLDEPALLERGLVDGARGVCKNLQ